MITCLLVTHGPLGESFLTSVEMITGRAEHLHAICLSEDAGIDVYCQQLTAFFKAHQNTDILILCDLLNGSPYIQALANARQILREGHFHVLAGCNLAMLLEAVLSNEEDMQLLKERLLKTGREAVCAFQKMEAVEEAEAL